jgi:hypothetical protein
MLLISGGKVSAALAAARNTIQNPTVLPTINTNVKRSKTLSPARGRDPGREAIENKSGLPSSMDSIRYCSFARSQKTARYGSLPPDDAEEQRQREIDEAAEPGPQESRLTDEEKALLADLRAELLLFAPDRAVVLEGIRNIVELQLVTLSAQETATSDLQVIHIAGSVNS